MDELPPIKKQAANIARAARRAARAAARKEAVLVSEEVKAERQAVCDICEFYVAQKRRCSKCGCNTNYKLKLATEACPEGKWSVIQVKC